MNYEVNYNDDAERSQTHPKLLPEDSSVAPPAMTRKNEGVTNALVAGAWIVRGRTPQPYNCRNVLGKSQVAAARRLLLLNTEWG